MYSLRPYQVNVVSSIQNEMSQFGNPVVVMPTGSGKSLIIAEIARWLNQSILILQPSVEILRQNKEKLLALVDKNDVGVYSASMGEKTIKTYTLATIGSVYRKPEHFNHFKLVIIDECHLVNHKKLSTMFMSFLRRIGNPKVVGLTATPYRQETWGERIKNGYYISHTTTKMINRCMNPFWNKIVACINIQDLINAGYLMPLEYIDKSIIQHDQLKANTSHTDYDLTDFQRKIADKEQVVLDAIEYAKKNCQHVLVFCASINQAENLASKCNGAVVTAKTGKKIRQKIVDDFRLGKIQTVFNVDCLTIGFDFPELDGIVVLRPTQSIRVHVQMLGRGVRTAPNKKSCKVIDMVGNVKRIGPVESVQIKRFDTGWDIVSFTGAWHNRELYQFTVKR
jgi:DNA repair protein RadD